MRVLGGADRGIDVRGTRLSDFGEDFFGRGIDGLEVLLRLRRDELAPDEESVFLLESKVLSRFGRRGVIPDRASEFEVGALAIEPRSGVFALLSVFDFSAHSGKLRIVKIVNQSFVK